MRHFCRIILLTALLCAARVVQAVPDMETGVEIAIDAPGLEYVARSTSAEESEGTHIPEPQTLLLAALAMCGLSAVHLRRRWG